MILPRAPFAPGSCGWRTPLRQLRQSAVAFCALLLLIISTHPSRAAVEIEEIRTALGPQAWVVTAQEIPAVSLTLSFSGGAAADPAGKEGLTHLMMALIEEGAGPYDAIGFADALAYLGARMSFSTYQDHVVIEVQYLSETQDQVAGLLRAALSAPQFAPDAIERVRGQINGMLASMSTDPEEIAEAALLAHGFAGHAYARPQYGTAESLNSLTREDLLAQHQAMFARDAVVIGAAGDITAQSLDAFMSDVLAALPEAHTLPAVPLVAFDPTSTEITIPFDQTQSQLAFGQPGVMRDDPDFYAAYVLNHILGGSGFSARLMQEIRVKEGLSYGVYSYLASFEKSAMIGGAFASANETMPQAVEILRREWARISATGVTAEELAHAKTNLTGSYPLRFDGNSKLSSMLIGLQRAHLPRSYPNERNGYIEALTLEEVNRVAAELFDPQKLTVVIVGMPESEEKP